MPRRTDADIPKIPAYGFTLLRRAPGFWDIEWLFARPGLFSTMRCHPPALLLEARMTRLVGSERRVRFAVIGSCGT
jgi:hypothetical protein